jgi:hypothetical protein
MVLEAGRPQDERVTGRVWTIRLDPYGRPSSGQVKLTCSRPTCPEQRIPQGAAAGRQAAVGHVKEHLTKVRDGGGPNGEAWCACRAAGCAWHTPDPTARAHGTTRTTSAPTPGPDKCGGPIVLSVHTDRAGRLWRIAETCTRCAALIPDCKILAAAVPPARPATQAPAAPRPQTSPAGAAGPGGAAAVFSDRTTTASPAAATAPTTVPAARTTPAPVSRRVGQRQWGKIGQRTVPATLQPTVLRDELIELGDAFRAYQARERPDTQMLAALLERKARAFDSWADVTGDDNLRHEARRAEKAAAETLRQRTGQPATVPTAHVAAAADGPLVEYLLTPGQAAHAREVLDYAAAHAPHPSAQARLAVLMLALRAARAGTGNITGQDLTGWLGSDAEQVLEQLVDSGWLQLPGTVTEAMASRPEDPTAFTVPQLLPDQPRRLDFGKTTRSRISGWAQKVTGDRKLRKKKAGPATRLLALYTAAHTRPDGHLGHPRETGVDLARAAAFATLTVDQVAEHVDVLVSADWLTDTTIRDGRLSGRLTERVLPLGGRL